MSNLNVLDYLILGILIISTLFGLARGFIRSFISLVIWLLIALACFYLGDSVAQFFTGLTTNHLVQLILAYAGIFIAGIFINWLIKLITDSFLADHEFSFTDHFFGGIFGIARGALLVTLLAWSIIFTHNDTQTPAQQSSLLPTFNKFAEKGLDLFTSQPLINHAGGSHP